MPFFSLVIIRDYYLRIIHTNLSTSIDIFWKYYFDVWFSWTGFSQNQLYILRSRMISQNCTYLRNIYIFFKITQVLTKKSVLISHQLPTFVHTCNVVRLETWTYTKTNIVMDRRSLVDGKLQFTSIIVKIHFLQVP